MRKEQLVSRWLKPRRPILGALLAPRSTFNAQRSTLSAQGSRLPAQGSRLKAHRSRLTAQGSRLVALSALLAGLTSAAGAQESVATGDGRAGLSGRIDAERAPRPALDAFATTRSIEIDGLLTEPAWSQADSAYNFTQAIPRDGFPATERTVVRILYDETTLYIGAMMYDSDVAARTVPGLEQDYETHNSDMFGVALDTYLDRANGLLFGVNPAGALFDAQTFNDSRYTNRAWEGVVHVKTAIHPDGWSAELAVPLTTMRFRPSVDAQDWGLNFIRRVRRINEDSYWAPLLRHYRVHKMSRAGTLRGLQDLRQGRNLSVKPFVKSGRVKSDNTAPGSETDFDAGFDVKYGLTSRLTLDLTVLTDFSQVEVDQEQVNLTRFSLFFPEKRDFFLENDGVFGLGDVSIRNYRTGSSARDFRLFHSRRIGLSDDRRPLPIGAGARLTGRAGDFEVGFLNMQTRREGDSPGENFTVARVRRNFAGNSDAGFMFVNRQGTSQGATGSYNRSFGADANIQLFRSMLVSTYYARTDEPGATGDQNAGYVQLAWRDGLFDTSTFVKHVGESFNPDVGFIRRRGIRQAFATFGLHPQPNVGFLQEVNPYFDVSFVADTNWDLETRELTGGLGTIFSDGGTLTLEYVHMLDRLPTETNIAGQLVRPGEYRFGEASASYTASGARAISGTARVSHGDFYDGTRTSVGGEAVLRPDYHVQVSLGAQHNDIVLAGNDFTADLFSAQIRTAFSTSLFASAFVQYNRSVHEVVSNVRLNYLHAPLSDFFLVFTERRNVELDVLIERGVSVKFTKLFGF